MMEFATFLSYLPAILHGLWITLASWIIASIGGVLLGLGVALLQRSSSLTVRAAVKVYVDALRCLPLLVMIFIVYAGGPSIGLMLDPLSAGILVLIVHGSAYFAEIFRGGFSAVPKGQIEAAHSLAMTPFAILRRVTLPGALTAAAPALINMIINVCKETALLSIITVADLTFEVQKMAIETFASFESILTLALGYWVLIEIFSRLGQRAERHINQHLNMKRSA
ncbi:amino acid ABC transporter permease [Pseudomonas fluorescens]|nr:amino acid ABC transporter permease [Pseudomonas fluorescens]